MARLFPIFHYSFSKFVAIAVASFPSVLFGQNVAGVTPYEYAVLSKFVYNDGEVGLPPGWRIFWSYIQPVKCIGGHPVIGLTDSECSYRGEAYRKGNLIVIAHRGSGNPFDLPEGTRHWFENLARLATGRLTNYYDVATEFTANVQSKINVSTNCGNCKIIAHTGHSLGGHIAELMAATYALPAITFDSPGSGIVITKNPGRRFQVSAKFMRNMVTTYNAAPNMINTMDNHLGPVTRLYPPYAHTDDLALPYTSQQHDMLGIVKQFNVTSMQPILQGDMSKLWPFSNGWPVTGGNNERLDTAFFKKYDVNPYYWEWYYGSKRYNTAKRIYRIQHALGGIGCFNTHKGVTVVGDNSPNPIWGSTNYADVIESGAGNDSIWPFGGNDYIHDTGGDDKYIFYAHNMGGITTIQDDDGIGGIFFRHLNCFLNGNIYRLNATIPNDYIFDPSSATNSCDTAFYSGGYKEFKWDGWHDITYDHGIDIVRIQRINNGTDLQISYMENQNGCPANREFQIGGYIVVKNFQNGNLGINLIDTVPLNVRSGTGVEYFMGSDNEQLEILRCDSNENSKVYGFSGNDVYQFYADGYYNCSLNGYPNGIKNYTAISGAYGSAGITEIHGLKDGDLIDLSDSSLKIQIEQVAFAVNGDYTSTITLPNGHQIILPYTMRDIQLTFDGQTVVNPLDYFTGIILPEWPGEDEFFLDLADNREHSNTPMNVRNLNGKNGFLVRKESNLLGADISCMGDVNGDGLGDVLVVNQYNSSQQTTVYVIYGSSKGFSPALTLDDLNGRNITAITDDIGHTPYLKLGVPGDVNGDGYDDIQIGTTAPGNVNGCIIFGSPQLPSQVLLSQLNGSNGFYITGGSLEIGKSRVGDLNADGLADMVMYNYGAPPNPTSKENMWFIFGSTGFPKYVNASAVNGSNGFRIKYYYGANTGDGIYTAGDINGDGIDDVYLGLSWGNTQLPAFVVFGSETFPSVLDLDNPGSQQIMKITVSHPDAGAIGSAGGKIGDFDNDGIDDLFVGAPGAAADVGSGFIVFGRGNFTSNINLTNLQAGEGIKITGFSLDTWFGASISYLGATSGSYGDEFVVAARSTNNSTGAAYLFHNNGQTEFPVEMNAANFTRHDVSVIEGKRPNDALGWQVSAGADVNGDGFGDFALSTPSQNPFDNGVAVVTRLRDNDDDVSAASSSVGNTCVLDNVIDVGQLNGYNGFVFVTPITVSSVSGLGDVNGDGIDDLAVGTAIGSDGTFAKNAYVVYGSLSPFRPIFSGNQITVSNGFVISDNAAPRAGPFVGYVGDMNRDGLNDIAGGNINWNAGVGYGFVYYGTKDTSQLNRATASLNGQNGFGVGSPGTNLPIGGGLNNRPVDLNGDGFPDFLTGGYCGDRCSSGGYVYVVYGSASGKPAVVNVTQLNGSNGVVIQGSAGLLSSYFGMRIGGLGDINGDGIDDVAISDMFAPVSPSSKPVDNTGRVHVIFGNKHFPNNFSADNLNGTNGFILHCLAPNSYLGSSVAGGGDINGDGINDIIIGAQNQVYVLFGSKNGYPSQIDLSSLNGQNGFVIDGSAGMGGAVALIPDFNGDGIDDLVVSSYIIFGSSKSFPKELNVTSMSNCNGISIVPTDASGFGKTVSYGDFNGDGLADVIIGADNYAAVIFGGFLPGPAPITNRSFSPFSFDVTTAIVVPSPTPNIQPIPQPVPIPPPNPCAGITCNNQGTCRNGVCTCSAGWSGSGCTVPPSTNPCAGITCNGQGTCSNGICTCSGGWSGSGCTIPPLTDPCAGITCNNQGICSNGICTCSGGWSGSGCTIPPSIDPCAGITCNGQGSCSNGVCTCSGGWSGAGCTIPPSTNPCAGISCNGQGSCSNGVCTCSGGWSGSGCTIPPSIDPCAGITCNAQGSCSNGVCTCSAGWSGSSCTVPPTLAPSTNQSASITIQANGTQQTAQLSVSIAPNIQDAGQTLNTPVSEITVSLQFSSQTSGVSLAAFGEAANMSASGINYNANVVVQPKATSLQNAQNQWNNFNGSFIVTITLSGANSSTRSFETLANDWLPLSVQYTPNGDGTFTMDILAGGNPFQSVQVAPLNTGGTIATDPVGIAVNANVTATSNASSANNGGTSSSSSGSKTAIIAGAVAGGVVGVAAITTTVVLLVKYFNSKAAAALASAVGSPNSAPNTAGSDIEMDDIGPSADPSTPSDANNKSAGNYRDIRNYRPDLMEGSSRIPFDSGNNSAVTLTMVDFDFTNGSGSTSVLNSPSGEPLLASDGQVGQSEYVQSYDEEEAALEDKDSDENWTQMVNPLRNVNVEAVVGFPRQ